MMEYGSSLCKSWYPAGIIATCDAGVLTESAAPLVVALVVARISGCMHCQNACFLCRVQATRSRSLGAVTVLRRTIVNQTCGTLQLAAAPAGLASVS